MMASYPRSAPSDSDSLFSPSEAKGFQAFLSDFSNDPLLEGGSSGPLSAAAVMNGYRSASGLGTGSSAAVGIGGGGWRPFMTAGGPAPAPLAPALLPALSNGYRPPLTYTPHASSFRPPPASSLQQPQGMPSASQVPFLPETPEARLARESRMKVQAQELSAWLSAKGIGADGGVTAVGNAGQATLPPQTPQNQRPTLPHLETLASSQRRSESLQCVTVAPAPQQQSLHVAQLVPVPLLAQKKTNKAKGKAKAEEQDEGMMGLQIGPKGKKEKPGLLSQEQKRANHIASEQKRRAAIRLGYDRLASLVPEISNGSGGADSDGEDSGGKKAAARKRKKDDGSSVAGGRSGPKSEAVVLARTVDYLQALNEERAQLLQRLGIAHETARRKGMHIESGPRVWEEPWSADGDVEEDEDEGDMGQ